MREYEVSMCAGCTRKPEKNSYNSWSPGMRAIKDCKLRDVGSVRS